jgi:hypothetical protein
VVPTQVSGYLCRGDPGYGRGTPQAAGYSRYLDPFGTERPLALGLAIPRSSVVRSKVVGDSTQRFAALRAV